MAASGPDCSWEICWATAADAVVGVRPHPRLEDLAPGRLEVAADLAASTAVEAAASAAEVSAEAEAASMVEAAAAAVEPEEDKGNALGGGPKEGPAACGWQGPFFVGVPLRVQSKG